MTSALALATRLGALDDDELHRVLASRQLNPARIDDMFDAAEALLAPASIQAALARLDRPTLAVLAVVAGSNATVDAATIAHALDEKRASERNLAARLAALDDALLIERTGTAARAYDAVRDRLAAWPDEGLPSAGQLANEPPPAALAVVPDADPRFSERVAAEHGFAAVGAVTDLLAELAREPAHELQKGGLGLPDLRRLSAATGIEEARLPVLLWSAEQAGLAARSGSSWLPRESAAAWLEMTSEQRWSMLASGWRASMPTDVRTLLEARAHARWDDSLRAFGAWLYPAAGSDVERRLNTFAAAADLLGITVSEGPSSFGVTLLERGADQAARAIAKHFPAEVDQVYLQRDLSVIAPGPLVPAVETRLRSIADVESRALASTFRVSGASIARAIAAGESAHSIRTFFETVSLTGIPQPLDYLISETAARYGRVRVRSAGTGSLVHSMDTALLDAIGIDQSLSALGLVRRGEALTSRFGRDAVLWALSDARYPVAAEDEAGHIVSVRRERPTAPPSRRESDPIDALIVRLRASGAPDAAQTARAWLSRQIDIAIRSRATLLVTVALPDGQETELLLEPTGVGGGRLRGRDRTADIERTLPLSSVKGIRTPDR